MEQTLHIINGTKPNNYFKIPIPIQYIQTDQSNMATKTLLLPVQGGQPGLNMSISHFQFQTQYPQPKQNFSL